MDLKKNPKISVIIPTYNRKVFLSEAIDSVLNQTFRDFELIVVDDGSTDGTGEFLKEKYGNKLRYFFKENGGCATARNFGIRNARGEYIAFLDSDDRYLPNKLEDHVAFLERNSFCGFVGSDIIVQGVKKSYLFKTLRPDSNGDIAHPLFIFTFFSLCAATFRRSCIEKVGYFDEDMRYNEDTDFLLKIAINSTAGFSPRPTLVYRAHEGGKSTDQVKLLQAVYESSANIIKLYPGFTLKANVDKRLGQIKLDLAMEQAVRNNTMKCMEELAMSQKIYPALKKTIYLFLMKRNLMSSPFILQIVLFTEKLQKALQLYLYRYTGIII